MRIGEFQELIKCTYLERDQKRGLDRTFLWFAEETGELARALKRPDPDELLKEFSDVLAWLVSLATLSGVDMEEAAQRYADGCPKCHKSPCACQFRR